MSTDPSVWDEIRRCEEQYERNPESLVFARLADAYRKAGEIDLALKVVADGISRHPDYASGHIVLARCHRDLGGTGEAIAAFQRVAELDPTNLVAIRSLGELSRETGNREGARAWYTQLAQLDPTNEETARLLADLGGPVEQESEAPDPEEPSSADGSFADTDELPGGGGWSGDRPESPGPLDAVQPAEDASGTGAHLDDDELLDWSTGELVSESAADSDEATPPSDDPFEPVTPFESVQTLDPDPFPEPSDPVDREPTEPEDTGPTELDESPESRIDDLWLEDLDAMLGAPSGGETAHAPEGDEGGEVEPHDPDATLELETPAPDGPAEMDPFVDATAGAVDEWLAEPGPLDAPADHVEIPETELPDFAVVDPELPDFAVVEPEPSVIADDGGFGEDAPDEAPPEDSGSPIDPRPGPMDWLAAPESLELVESLPDSAEEETETSEPDFPEADAEPSEPPVDEPPATERDAEDASSDDAPWWEELAQAGLNVGGGAEIESLVEDAQPAEPPPSVLDSLWREEAPESVGEPTPAGSDDADIMTRTMADLYVDQGLYEEAIEIYEELLADRPDDPELQARLEAVRARSGGAEAESAETVEADGSDESMADEPAPAGEGDDTIPLAVYQPQIYEAPTDPEGQAAPSVPEAEPEPVAVPEAEPEPEPETGPWIGEELTSILRAGDRLADERGDEEESSEPAEAGSVLEDWLRRLER